MSNTTLNPDSSCESSDYDDTLPSSASSLSLSSLSPSSSSESDAICDPQVETLVNNDASLQFQGDLDDIDENILDVPPVSSESDDDDEETSSTMFEFLTKLGKWSSDCNLPRERLNQLLEILAQSGRFRNSDLPRDGRSLLCTPRDIDVQIKCGGQMVYFGINEGLLQWTSTILSAFPVLSSLQLNINIDGLPIQSSSNLQFWPILGTIHGKNIGPFVIALYCGKQKPNNVTDYLQEFVNEICDLHENGILINNKQYYLKLHAFICDAPARAFIKCVAGHTSKHGCERCNCIGKSVERRIVFGSAGVDRTDVAFRGDEYPLHKNRASPLLQIVGLDMIRMFVLDSMHLLYLGVCRRLLFFFKSGPRVVRLSHAQLDNISLRLIEVAQRTPSEFARRPRSLFELERWKATELRQFVLYTGIFVLKGVVSDELYQLFVAFCVAMRILHISDANERNKKLTFARNLLSAFVHNASVLCGNIFTTCNVHNLLHIVDDVQYFQCPLASLSGFVFENYLQSLKRTVRGAKSNPLVSASKRFCEHSHFDELPKASKKAFIKVSTNIRDKYFLCKDGLYCEVVEILDDNRLVCSVFPPEKLNAFFSRPFSSTSLGILACGNANIVRPKSKVLQTSDIKQKLYVMNDHIDGFLFIPVLHDMHECKI